MLNIEETAELLLENPKSFCRFGDGEVLFMRGRPLPFQEYDKNLDLRLREILQSSSDKCYVGIDDRYFDLSKEHKDWMRLTGLAVRQELLKYCNKKRLYIASTFTFAYMQAKTQEEAFRRIEMNKKLFLGRNLVIFSGSTVFDKINYNVFEYAADRKHIFCESRHAWRQYKEILDTARKFPKDKVTLCFILGPTATVAAWDLAHEGYTAWDIGHMAKDYDAFIKKIEKTPQYIQEFVAPD